MERKKTAQQERIRNASKVRSEQLAQATPDERKALLAPPSPAVVKKKKDSGKDLTPSQKRSDRRHREELILGYFAANKSAEEIAELVSMTPYAVERLQASGLDKALRGYTRLNPQQTFLQYAIFNMRLIRRLNEACDLFMGEEGTQYNALISAIKAESDIYDKIHAKGVEYDVIAKRKVKAEVTMKQTDLLKALQDERSNLDDLIGELHVSVEKTKMKVKLTKKRSVEDHPEVVDGSVNQEEEVAQTVPIHDSEVYRNVTLAEGIEDGSAKRQAIEVHEDDGE